MKLDYFAIIELSSKGIFQKRFDMSDQNLLSFNDLLGLTFDDGAVHIRHLQMLFKILVTQLKLEDVQVNFEDQNLLSCANNVKISKESNEILSVASLQSHPIRIDPVVNAVPTTDDLMKNLCNADSNPLVDMLNLLNLTKRVEAVEVSLLKMTSLMQSVLKNQSDVKQESKEPVKNSEEVNPPRKTHSPVRAEQPVISESSPASPVSSFYSHHTSSHTESESLSITLKSNESESSSKSSIEVSIESSSQNLNREEIVNIVKQQIDSEMKLFLAKFDLIEQKICELQKSLSNLQEQLDDVMFGNEQNDMKIDETMREISNFNSEIFFLKTDVKTLLESSIECEKKFDEMGFKYETMNNIKTNKSYVDELLSQKAYKSDLEKFVLYEDFDPIRDILCLKLSLVEESMAKLQMELKKRLACFKFELDGKLDKNDLCKFKTNVSTFFDSFLAELQAILLEVMTNSIGLGSSLNLTPKLNCISCESKIVMKKSTTCIPQLKSTAARFHHKLDKACKREKPRSDYRVLLGEDRNLHRTKTEQPHCNDNLLNFPNSQPCFIICKDNTIVRADPLQCLKNAKYTKI